MHENRHHCRSKNVILGLQDEMRRSEGSRYDHRLHGLLLVAYGMLPPFMFSSRYKVEAVWPSAPAPPSAFTSSRISWVTTAGVSRTTPIRHYQHGGCGEPVGRCNVDAGSLSPCFRTERPSSRSVVRDWRRKPQPPRVAAVVTPPTTVITSAAVIASTASIVASTASIVSAAIVASAAVIPSDMT